jgi:hypothetical protein
MGTRRSLRSSWRLCDDARVYCATFYCHGTKNTGEFAHGPWFFFFGEAADSVAPAVILALCFVSHLGPGHAHCPNMQSVSLHFLLQWWSLWSSASLLNFLMKGICGVQFLVG